MSNNKKKEPWEASYEATMNIQKILNDFWSLPELWKSLAKAGTTLATLQQTMLKNGDSMQAEELDDLVTILNQFGMFLQALKPIENDGKQQS